MFYYTFSGVCCGLYTTNTSEANEFALNDSGAEIVVVENKEQVDKILKCRVKCKITSIIQYTGEVTDNKNGLIKTVSLYLLPF
jgi:long-subunit acyl-CoA synthetase (AMP-forming)